MTGRQSETKKLRATIERITRRRCNRFGLYSAAFLLALCLSNEGNTAHYPKKMQKDYVIARPQARLAIDLFIPFGYRSVRIERDPALIIEQLSELGKALADRKIKGSAILIAGNTAIEGDDAYELELSKLRAEAIKRFLVENFEINPDTLVTVGYGSTKLSDPGDPRSQNNRRVGIVNMGPISNSP